MSDSNPESLDVSFRDLQIFVSVARTGSFRAAAERMYTSQPSVTRAVARLESTFGEQLLDRGPRGAVVTVAGQTMLEHARRLGAQITDLRAELKGGVRSSLRLGAAATAAGSYLAPFLTQWIPAHPTVRIEVIEDGSVALRERLAAGECDLAIVALPAGIGLESVVVAEAGVRAYFPPGHPLDTGERAVTIEELADHAIVMNTEGFIAARLFSQECEASGVFPEIRYRSQVGQTLAALADAGLGVGVFADSVSLRGFQLESRLVQKSSGDPLAFTLAAAWPRIGTPPWIEEFGRSLARFTQATKGERRLLNPPARP
ncbi:LysR family transcriptional regulator [Agromyces silvae]|uniref:LysR family transcriptional regulator n=1 Tax=Agromyces silvae TaxID=3388266 RepID=UPI00280AD8C4|nr:LysR family transcriptional regulator [Agromyces protaetiae]